MNREDELAEALADVESRLRAAARAAGRTRDELTLVAISKTWPAQDIVALHALGVTDFGENRDEEARDKAAALMGLRGAGLRWHFVGSVQSSKARSVASYADVVHSLDRLSLLRALSAGAVRAGRTLDVLLQVSLDGDQRRGGAVATDVPALAAATERVPGLRLAGVMAVAPLGADPSKAFADLAVTAARVRADHPAASWISAGMSGDLEQAVAAGATHVRVGSALFGHRPPILR